MQVRQLTEDFAVAPQISVAHVGAIADAGFKSLVCNRPDEEPGAVDHQLIEEAARAAGLQFRFIPVVSGAMTMDNVREMRAALDDLPRPVLAYCLSGGRCQNLFMMAEQLRD